MGIINLFSKRKKLAERGNEPEVYQYNELPIEFRRQVIHIWTTSIGNYIQQEKYSYDSYGTPLTNKWWDKIHNSVARELGLFELGNGYNPYDKCQDFLLDDNTSVDNHLDLIEFTFIFIDKIIRNHISNYQIRERLRISQKLDDAISELNHRFCEHSIGYQYVNGQIIRVDSGFIHAEVVKPALCLLNSQGFEGAEEEFRNAHENYRHRKYKNAIADALKSFESTLKTICDKRGWSYNKNDTAKKLIDVVLQNELIPRYLESYFSGLRQVLEAGVPTVRNKTSGHGQGAQPTEVPEYLASYVLHMTASNIVFLVEAYKAK